MIDMEAGIYCRNTKRTRLLEDMNIIHMYIDITVFYSIISLIKLINISIR
jgi:hypothetical protein